jgi:hypothetical protein
MERLQLYPMGMATLEELDAGIEREMARIQKRAKTKNAAGNTGRGFGFWSSHGGACLEIRRPAANASSPALPDHRNLLSARFPHKSNSPAEHYWQDACAPCLSKAQLGFSCVALASEAILFCIPAALACAGFGW